MKQMSVDKADLASCVSQAQNERVVITRKGKPVALVVGIEGLDREQIELGSSDRFWKLITKRRKQKGAELGCFGTSGQSQEIESALLGQIIEPWFVGKGP